MSKVSPAWLLGTLLTPFVALSAPSGQVIGIADGDTLTVLVDHRPVKVRLAEIDAPEKAQPFGTRSRQSLSELCFRKSARLDVQTIDRYGRTIAKVTCDDVDANAEQVRRGMAWVFDRYAARGSPFYALQQEARDAKRGLWSSSHAVPPWEWRESSRRSPQR